MLEFLPSPVLRHDPMLDTALLFEAARFRVENVDALAPLYDTIFADWDNWVEHLNWVCTATVDQIVEWASYADAMYNGVYVVSGCEWEEENDA